MIKKLILTLITLTLCCLQAYGQNFPGKADKTISEIETQLEKLTDTTLETNNVIKFKKDLRAIQKNAQEKIDKLTQEKEIQQHYLDILGPAPDKDKGEQEAESVSKLRKNINDQLIKIDGIIKAERLSIVRSSDLVNNLNELRQENLQSKLSERLPSPFMPRALLNAFDQSILYLQGINFDLHTILLGMFFCGLIISALPITKLINHYRQSLSSVGIYPISYRLIMQFIIATILVINIRFSNIQGSNFTELVHLIQACCAIILSLSLYELLGKIKLKNTSQPETEGYLSPFWRWLKNRLRFIALIFIPLSIIGFTEFSVFALFNFYTLILAWVLFVALRLLTIKLLCLLEIKRQEDHTTNVFLEASTIVILEPIIAVITLMLVLLLWGIDLTEVKLWLSQYSSGIPIGQLTLNFEDLSAALLSFTAIYLFFKLIKWFFSARVFPNANLDIGIVNAVLTILGYVGITLALISAGGALGFDASSLALVAGALSVGIGFGLQTIFSNFVSGLILLFERPFKVGDWVHVNQFEGIIRRISVRSTEIETFQRASVIVPNSQMISDVVTNRTLHNAHTRLEIPVGVAYGSDTEKVKTLLLECAEENDNVLKYPQPFVLFVNFGDSSLDFELRCYINNVHSSPTLSSDIRFAIDQKFRDHHIEIPFPQRDVHIKQGI